MTSPDTRTVTTVTPLSTAKGTRRRRAAPRTAAAMGTTDLVEAAQEAAADNPSDLATQKGERLIGDDPWGRSTTFCRWAARLAGIRWNVSVGGIQHIPATGAALIVCNERLGGFNPLLTAWALTERSGRVVRFTGVVDIAPIGPLSRKIGGLLSDPAEVAGALRAGEVVLIGASATRMGRHAGRINAEQIEAAASLSVAIIPVATISAPLSRSARVEVGERIHQRKHRVGPLIGPELADETRFRLQRLLDQTAQPGSLMSVVSA